MKLCLTASPGGHLVQLWMLNEFYSKHDYFFVTFYSEPMKEFAKKDKFYFVTDPGRNILRFFGNIIQSLKIFIKERPDCVISTGAGVSIAMCWWAKIFGKKVVFIEDWCVVESPSVSGRVVYPIADLFIIQWERLQRFYPKARFGGPLI